MNPIIKNQMKTKLFCLFILSILVMTGFSQIPINGLVAWYPFAGNASDASGNGNNGTVNGATLTTDRFGNVSSAYSFDGVNDNINCGNGASLQISGDISVCGWVKTNTIIMSNLISKYKTSTAGWELVIDPAGKVHFGGRPGSGYCSSGISSLVNNSSWHFLVGQRLGTQWQIYFDGLLSSSTNCISGSIQTAYNLTFGSESLNTYFFNGTLDDIRIYNRALTLAEITALYGESPPPVLGELQISQLPFVGISSITAYKTINNKIYLFGAQLPPYSGAYTASNNIRSFDLTTNTWNTLPFNLPYPVFDNINASYLDGHFYFGPGWTTGNSNGFGTHKKMIDVNLNTNTSFETINQFATNSIWAISSIENNGNILFLGGYFYPTSVKPIYAFIPPVNSFNQLANFNIGRSSVSSALGNDGWIYCFGGTYNNSPTLVIERFNPNNYQVQTMDTTSIPGNLSGGMNFWNFPSENSIYFFMNNYANPAIYSYNYVSNTTTNTGIIANGTFGNRSILDSNDPHSIYCFKLNPDNNSPLQLVKLTLSTFSIPINQATNITFSNVQTNQFSFNWTDGSGAKRAVFIKQDSVGTAAPVNNITYNANTTFGSGSQIGTTGWYCVFNGTTHSSGVTVTNLLPNTNYRVMVSEYNGNPGTEQYNTSVALNNPKTQKTCSSGSVPTYGLLAWYPFSGNANDATGLGNNGTVHGATLTSDRFGNANYAYSFNAAAKNYIELNNQIGKFGTSDFTISTWYNSTDGGGIVICKRNTESYDNFWEFYMSRFGICQNTSSATLSTIYYSPLPSLNVWHHSLIVKTSTELRLYIDGILNSILPIAINYNITNNNPAEIGSQIAPVSGVVGCFNGKIDDIRIYNRALSDCEITSLYQEPASFNISLVSNPVNGGTVTGGGTYNSNTPITVTATTNTGYTFMNWTESGNVVSTSPSYSFTVSSNRNLVANFSVQQFVVTTSSSPAIGGNTSGGGTFIANTPIIVAAVPNTGYSFVNWTENGNIVSTSQNYAFTVSANRNLNANFALQQFIITTSSIPANGGNTSGGGTFSYGTSVTVMASANSGWVFNYWSENGFMVSNNPNYIFTATSNRNLVANFILQGVQYTITATTNPTNAGYTTGGGIYNSGALATVNAFPNSGWAFVNWTEFGSQVSTAPNYTFTVIGNRDLVANFGLEYIVTAIAIPANSGYTTGGGAYIAGQTAILQAFSSIGWSFENWTENNTVVSTNSVYSFAVNNSRSFEANFHSIVGMDEQLNKGIRIYPNPTNDRLFISFERAIIPSTVEIQITNSHGQTVYKTEINAVNKNISLDLKELNPGLYYLLLTDEVMRKIADFKIVIQQ
jgi:hypothetical protein